MLRVCRSLRSLPSFFAVQPLPAAVVVEIKPVLIAQSPLSVHHLLAHFVYKKTNKLRMVWVIYNLVFPVIFLMMLPKFLLRMARRGGYVRHFEQRFGIYGEGVRHRLAGPPRVWIHAVSVGELQVALQWIDAVRRSDPEQRFIVSTNTSTGHQLAQKRLDERELLIYFPIDLPFVMQRVLRILNPARIVLVEGEFWPNLIRQAHKKGVPVALINGRISNSSFRGYQKVRPLMRQILRRIDPICVQGRQDADRVRALGARPESICITGTAKYDAAGHADRVAPRSRNLLHECGLHSDRPVLLGGSTWPGEEEALCRVVGSLRKNGVDPVLILVPRHAERRNEVLRAVEELGFRPLLRSAGSNARHPDPDVLIVDTTGELLDFYATADVVFVGKSLCGNCGGQNPIEPALLGKAVVTGPEMQNFTAVMDDFLSAGAIRQIQNEADLQVVIGELFSNPEERERLGAAAYDVVAAHRGAIEQMVDAVFHAKDATRRFLGSQSRHT